MTRVEERGDLLGAEDGREFFVPQRLPCVIAFDKFELILLCQFAQETPGVAAGGSGAFVPKRNHSPQFCTPAIIAPIFERGVSFINFFTLL